jgi:shikimate kinase
MQNQPSAIVLVGMMGCGKSSLGRLLAESFGWRFIDTDTYIEKESGVSIPMIFELGGEEEFRRRETRALSAVLKEQKAVIATGGGIVTREANRTLIKESGLPVLFLKVSPETAYERTRFSDRPLLQTEDPLAKIRSLLQVREPLYKEVSTYELMAGEKSLHTLVAEVADRFNISVICQR